MERVKECGQTAIACTDHGVMYGCVQFYKAAKKAGIKPIIGCEVYVATRTRFDKVNKIDGNNHLILLCKNETGYKNLIKMVSAGFVEGFYSKPRVDKQLLEQYHEGLIRLSACLAGEIPQAILAGDYERAKATALWYRDLFGAENYYIELQDHGLKEDTTVLPQLIKLSRETGIPMAATNDAHYLRKEDAKMQSILLCSPPLNWIISCFRKLLNFPLFTQSTLWTYYRAQKCSMIQVVHRWIIPIGYCVGICFPLM